MQMGSNGENQPELQGAPPQAGFRASLLLLHAGDTGFSVEFTLHLESACFFLVSLPCASNSWELKTVVCLPPLSLHSVKK